MRIISRNLDFAQLTIQARLNAGPVGALKLIVRDILAQAPVLLKLNIFQELNIGALPLVPYMVSLKPKESGDVHVEIYHFAHNTSNQDEAAPSETSDPGSADISSSGGKRLGGYNHATSYNAVINSITSSHKAQSSEATPSSSSGSFSFGRDFKTENGAIETHGSRTSDGGSISNDRRSTVESAASGMRPMGTVEKARVINKTLASGPQVLACL